MKATILILVLFSAFSYSQAEQNIGLFEQCFLTVRPMGSVKTKRQPFKLIQNNNDAVIYAATIGEVSARIIHNSGKSARFKYSQTAQYQLEAKKREESERVTREIEKKEAADFLVEKQKQIKEREDALKFFLDGETNPKIREQLKQQVERDIEEIKSRTYQWSDRNEVQDFKVYWFYQIIDSEEVEPQMLTYSVPTQSNAADSASLDEFLAKNIKNEEDLLSGYVNPETGRLAEFLTGVQNMGAPRTEFAISCGRQF